VGDLIPISPLPTLNPCVRTNWVTIIESQTPFGGLTKMPRDCTALRKLVVMYSPGRTSGIQYNMQRKPRLRTKPFGARSRAPRREFGETRGDSSAIQQRFAPAAVSTSIGARQSRIVTFSRSEVCAALPFTAGAFNLTTALSGRNLVHPGNPLLFPWLSNVAPCYEKYRVRKLVFRYISGNPTVASGLVFMAVDTDPSDPLPSNVGEVMGNINSVSGSIWQGVSLSVSARDLMAGLEWRFTASHQAVVEPRTTYMGQLLCAADGVDVDRSVTLQVEYEFDFMVEQVPEIGEQVLTQTNYGVDPAGNIPTLRMGAGIAQVVMSGTGAPVFTGLPALSGTLNAIDLGPYPSGELFTRARTTKAATMLSTLLAGADTDVVMIDNLGVFLGYASGSGPAVMTRAAGAETGTGLTVEGVQGYMDSIFHVAPAMALLPTLRYLMPVVFQAVAGDTHFFDGVLSHR